MTGYNNGKMAVSQRALVAALRCHPRKIVSGIAELMEHGLIEVAVEGKWKERLAREYRLTFVSTKGVRATNEYLAWASQEESGASNVESAKLKSASAVEPVPEKVAASVEAEWLPEAQKAAIF